MQKKKKAAKAKGPKYRAPVTYTTLLLCTGGEERAGRIFLSPKHLPLNKVPVTKILKGKETGTPQCTEEEATKPVQVTHRETSTL